MSLLGIHYYIPTRIATCIPPSCIINQTWSCETVDFTGPCVMWWICWRTIWMICFWWLFSRHIWIQKTTPCRWFMTSVMAVWHLRCSSLSGPEVVNLPVQRAVAWTHGRQVVHWVFFWGVVFLVCHLSRCYPPGRVKKAWILVYERWFFATPPPKLSTKSSLNSYLLPLMNPTVEIEWIFCKHQEGYEHCRN